MSTTASTTVTAAAADPAARPPRHSATLVLVRDGTKGTAGTKGTGGLEVLLMQRAERGDHNSSAWVFPGGLTDLRDREADPHAIGLDDATASAQLGLPSRGLDFQLAAVRECFEEAGLLLCDGPLPPPACWPNGAARCSAASAAWASSAPPPASGSRSAS